ncbi:unnamed protein product [Rhizoctonia solani]|uniref:F-box domain-containing protein n=1 Tax=Rhizoctonia solani TaxID=456999 RepID=A0A8H3I013_9AGAM|nr:unnamed protein product [Rhizoctonia solani]
MATAISLDKPHTQAEPSKAYNFMGTLPNETLARIFILGKKAERYDDYNNGHGHQRRSCTLGAPFQVRTAQVCKRWRAIVIGMPELWSHIEIRSQKILDHLLVYLQRAGPNTLLEIEVDLRNHITPPTIDAWDAGDLTGYHEPDVGHQVKLVKEALGCLVFNGGEPSRWVELAFWAKSYEPVVAVVEFLAGFALSNLRRLLLVNSKEYVTKFWLDAASARVGRLFRRPPPLLHSAKLINLPSTLMFNNNNLKTASISNLTYLSLKFGEMGARPRLEGLRSLFSHNRQVETLILNLSEIGGGVVIPEPGLADARVSLPCLQRFSFQIPKSRTWAVHLFQMIDAPRLESLSLFCGDLHDSMDEIAFYLTYGVSEIIGGAQTQIGGSASYSPIYPALQHLALISYAGGRKALHALLSSLSKLSDLDWALMYNIPKLLERVFSSPGVCPNLERLRVKGASEDELVRTVDAIIQSGSPLKTVQVQARNWRAYGSKLSERFFIPGQGPRVEAIGPYIPGALEGEESDFDV